METKNVFETYCSVWFSSCRLLAMHKVSFVFFLFFECTNVSVCEYFEDSLLFAVVLTISSLTPSEHEDEDYDISSPKLRRIALMSDEFGE